MMTLDTARSDDEICHITRDPSITEWQVRVVHGLVEYIYLTEHPIIPTGAPPIPRRMLQAIYAMPVFLACQELAEK
jgi:hypothetical protein